MVSFGRKLTDNVPADGVAVSREYYVWLKSIVQGG